MYATDSMPSCDICLCASVGRGVQSAFNIINAADFDVTSFRSGLFSSCLSRSPYAYPPPSYTGMYGAIPYSRASDYPLTHPSSSRGAGLASEGPTATPTQLSPSLSEYQPQAYDCVASSSMQF